MICEMRLKVNFQISILLRSLTLYRLLFSPSVSQKIDQSLQVLLIVIDKRRDSDSTLSPPDTGFGLA